MARATAIQVFAHLPKKNCGECGKNTCMGYAIALVEGNKGIEDCPRLSEEQKKKIADLLSPKVAVVEIGCADKAVKIGGEDVMYRHELRFMNPPPVLVDISDLMEKEEIRRRIEYAKTFAIERLGTKLHVDGIALRCASGRPERFKQLAEAVATMYDGPMALCSFDAKVIAAGMEAAGGRRPLVYAANESNHKEVLEIAKKYDSPLVIYSPDLNALRKMAEKISSTGYRKIVLDPGLAQGAGLASSLERYVIARKAAVKGFKDLAYPLLASTAYIWTSPRCEKEPEKCAYMESMYASALIMRYASLLIMNTIEPWAILPVLTLRHGIYSDPRVEPAVEARLYSIGTPGRESPVILTTNFALTYHSVSRDLEDAKVSCHILVVDTGGLAASVAVAAEKLTPAAIKDSLVKNAVAEKVAHRTLIIPGVAAGLRETIANETGWHVITGPQDSSQLAEFLRSITTGCHG